MAIRSSGGPLPERVGVQRLLELRILHEVRVAGRHVGQHAQRDRLGVGQVGQPGGERIVERDHLLVDQSQQQRGDM